MAAESHPEFLKRFVLEVTPPPSLSPTASPSSESIEQSIAAPFELRFHSNETIVADDDTAAFRQPWTATDAAAQRQWLTDTHRVWQSIAETSSDDRRDEYWMIDYALIVRRTLTARGDGTGDDDESGNKSRGAKRRKRSVAATASTTSTMALEVDSAPSTFRAVLAHPSPLSAGASAGRVFFRHDDDAKQKLRSFDKGFFGRFIDRVRQHNSTINGASTNSTGQLELLIGGSAPLAATCLIATFEPNDIDMYIRRISNASITALHTIIKSLLNPGHEAVVLLRKPLTLTWAIYMRSHGNKLPILHRLQLNLLHTATWAEVFAIYHSDLACCGFDVTHNRFVVLYDRWYRFCNSLRPAAAVSDLPTTSSSSKYRDHHDRKKNKIIAPLHSSSPLYFSNTWNLDSPYTLAMAADKYIDRGFKAQAIESRDAVLQPEGTTQQLELQARHPLGGEMEMTMSSLGGMMYGVKLSPMPFSHNKYGVGVDSQYLDRNDLVGWLVGLCMCRLYKVAVQVADVLLPDDNSSTQPPPLLFLRWLGARHFSWNTSSLLAQGQTAAARSELSQQLLLFGLQPADVPWQLAADFDGRYGAAFLLAPLLLSLVDEEYNNAFSLRQLLAAISDASAVNSITAAAQAYLGSYARPATDDRPEVPAQNISATDFNDLQFDSDMDERDARVDDEILGRLGKTLGVSSACDKYRVYTADNEDDEAEFDEDDENEGDGNNADSADEKDVEVVEFNDDDEDERDLHERQQVRRINGTYRYGLVQITRALIANGHLSQYRLTRFYPWTVRYFHAIFLRHRRAVTQRLLMMQNDDLLPLHQDLKRVVADYV